MGWDFTHRAVGEGAQDGWLSRGDHGGPGQSRVPILITGGDKRIRSQTVDPSGPIAQAANADIGLIGTWSLNQTFGFSRRYGDVSFEAYLMYTDGIANDLLSTTQTWGGIGIRLRY